MAKLYASVLVCPPRKELDVEKFLAAERSALAGHRSLAAAILEEREDAFPQSQLPPQDFFGRRNSRTINTVTVATTTAGAATLCQFSASQVIGSAD